MRWLRDLEGALTRAESALAVVLVLVMLALAAYNVAYRNVLVPLQQHWAHSGPPREPARSSGDGGDALADKGAEAPEASGGTGDGPSPASTTEPDGAGDFGGFGGGLEDPPEDKPPAKVDERDDDRPPGAAEGGDFGGFGGGFEDASDDEPAAQRPAAADFGGFGGDLDADPSRASSAEPDDGAGDFGGGLEAEEDPDVSADGALDDFGEDDLGEEEDPFADMPDIDAVGQDAIAASGPQGGPPPEGSFAAWGVAFIDSIKLDWIDIFLRQLVIIVSFLGAALATPRRKHINIDALSKILPASARRAVGIAMPSFALVICLVLARAGWDLVQVSLEYPKELLPFATEWQMQLMFPVGFGLLAIHFVVQVAAAAATTTTDPPPDEPSSPMVSPAVTDPSDPGTHATGGQG